MKDLVPQVIRSQYGGEYAWGIKTGVRFMSSLCKQSPVDWLAYVIEDGHAGAGHVKQWFADVKMEPPGSPFRWHVWSDTWVGKEELITHAPDLLAYEWAGCDGKADSPIIAALRAEHPRFLFSDYDRESLAAAVADVIGLEAAAKTWRDRQRRERRRARTGQ